MISMINKSKTSYIKIEESIIFHNTIKVEVIFIFNERAVKVQSVKVVIGTLRLFSILSNLTKIMMNKSHQIARAGCELRYVKYPISS